MYSFHLTFDCTLKLDWDRNEVGQEPFEYHDVEPSGDFYDNYDDELVETDLPAGQNPFEPRQPEILQHGSK